ncbi:MAG: preprotein translocase subunit YajC [Bacteroidota bacterium]|nr:preprotein translocase subunit YajC [Bacteroidota bacterium]MDP4191670.1 preprotein translocase subunit YajC [Bacteroidota bacterium]MDP4195962.1 preprotein translocase subunit YajC [Bacteroidota bacterium]
MDLLIAMAPQPGQQGGGSLISTFIMFGAIFLIFYFMIIRPQQKKAKERDVLLSNLQKGDKIITNGGIHGTIEGLEEKTALVKIDDHVKIKIERSAIATVLK